MIKITKLLFGLYILLSSTRLWSQVYPISNNFNLQGGSSPVLSDLCNSISPKLNIVLQNKDFQRLQIDCRLSIRIEGSNGELLETKPNYSAANPISLFAGSIQTVSGDEIAPYLAFQNMDMSGFDLQQFQNDGALPEGSYTFKIKVYRWNGIEQLSQESMANSFFNLSDPPLISSPQNEAAIEAMMPQSIPFSWSPRHSPLPDNSEVEYKFELWEVAPNINPQEAALAQQPIQVITTTNLNLMYDMSNTNLDTGKTYAWRVRAQTVGGKGYFRSNGYSEVYSFRYLGADTDERYTNYRLEYKTKNGKKWVPAKCDEGEGSAILLAQNKDYQARVQGYNEEDDFYGFTSEVIDFKTPNINVIECGEAPAASTKPLRPPLAEGKVGDVIKMDGLYMYCTKIEGENGTFSGEGIVNLPFLINLLAGYELVKKKTNDKIDAASKDALDEVDGATGMDASGKVADKAKEGVAAVTGMTDSYLKTGFSVTFEDIKVDDDYNLIEGKVVVVKRDAEEKK
jgi:hypothetical protein